MPVVLAETPFPFPPAPPRKRWTRQEIELLEQSGAWDGQRYELVEGDLIHKMGKHLPHMLATKRVVRALAKVFGWDALGLEVSLDVSPADHPTSDPEPDVLVLNRDPATIVGKQPQASDVSLVVEVSDSTLQFDLTVKARLYARAGIPEYWVLDLQGARLIVHQDIAEGIYKSVAAYSAGESVTPLASPLSGVAVRELLGEITLP